MFLENNNKIKNNKILKNSYLMQWKMKISHQKLFTLDWQGQKISFYFIYITFTDWIKLYC